MKRLLAISLLLFAVCAVNGYAEAFTKRVIPIKPEATTILPWFDRAHVEVKFIDDADIGLSSVGVPLDRSGQLLKSAKSVQVYQQIARGNGVWRRMSGVEEARMDELQQTAENNLKREIADINNYFILTVPDGITTEEWIDQLNSLDEVEIALAMPSPVVPPVIPGNYFSLQGYVNAAPDGIGAWAAWSIPGGTGWPGAVGPVRICDFEYSWNANHQDFPSVNYQHAPLLTPSDPFADDNHGTAVLGEMHSLSNGWGTTGAIPASIVYTSPVYLDAAWDIGSALAWMMSGIGGPGNIFVIEQQFPGPNYTGVPSGTQDGLIPVEWWLSWYNLIVTAVGNGINVVEAAGNGRENLDAAIYAVGNGGHWPFLPANNSGAIIVGAGAAPAGFGGSDVDRSRLWFSNYGSRVELQGWGERVMTTGYGNYYSAEGKDYWYTNTFSGTSSATPIVAAAVGILESIFRDQTASNLTPAQVRSLLITTGSPQQAGTYPISEHIGPRPDLSAAIPMLPIGCCVGDVGSVVLDVGTDCITITSQVVDVEDLTNMIDHLFINFTPLCCIDEGDIAPLISGGSQNGVVDVDDLTGLIDHLFINFPAMPACP